MHIVQEIEVKVGSATCTKLSITLSDWAEIQNWKSDALAHTPTYSMPPLHTLLEDVLNQSAPGNTVIKPCSTAED